MADTCEKSFVWDSYAPLSRMNRFAILYQRITLLKYERNGRRIPINAHMSMSLRYRYLAGTPIDKDM